jgi:hypothetical protein
MLQWAKNFTPYGLFGSKTASQLKVPTSEIFYISDFHDFYTIKSLQKGDFGVKIKCIKKIFMGMNCLILMNAVPLKHAGHRYALGTDAYP